MPERISKEWDFFISHASEDKQQAALPLTAELENREFKVWLDKFVLQPGEPVEEKISAGLNNCYYGIVVLSPNFLRKDWPTRELNTLLAVEKIDARRRILTIRHNISKEQLGRLAPRMVTRTNISTGIGMKSICNKIQEEIIASATGHDIEPTQHDPATPFPMFRALGVLKCKNKNCSWEVPAEIMSLLGRDPGPEFSVARRDVGWCVVCGSCGETSLGPASPQEVKKIVSLVTIGGIWAPEKNR